MTKITKVLPKILMLCISMLLFSCHVDHHHHDHIDERYPFLGEYHAVETFYNPSIGAYESFEYDLEIIEGRNDGLEIVVTGYGNGGIYGTHCSLVGDAHDSHVHIPVNICHYSALVDYEISGYGDLSYDGRHLTFELNVVRCEGGHCHDEPLVEIHAHRH